MDQFQSPNSAPVRSPQDLRAGFGHDVNASLEVSLVVDAQSDFRLNAANSPTRGEVHVLGFGHAREELGAAENDFQAERELREQYEETALPDRVMSRPAVVEFADREKDLEEEAHTETREDREYDGFLVSKGEESVEGTIQSAGEVSQAGMNRQTEITADLLLSEKGGVKADCLESCKLDENMLESDDEQEGRIGTLEKDDNDDHVSALGEALGSPIGAQFSGDEDDRNEILEAYKPAGLDEEQGTLELEDNDGDDRNEILEAYKPAGLDEEQGALELDDNDDNSTDLEEGQGRSMGAQVSSDYDSMAGILGVDKLTSFDEEQEGRNEELEQDDNDDNAAALEEGLGCSIGAQVSGGDDDMPGILGADKSGVSEEEKTGVSDEANTGTSEEKMGGAGRDNAGIAVKASQKRKSSSSLAPVTGTTNGQGHVDTGIKKAKKKPVNVWAKTSSRKGGKKSSKNGSQQNPAKEDCVLLTPVCRTQEKNDDGPNVAIVLSKVDKAEKVELSQDRLSAGSTKGYRMVRATRGVIDGTWYFEILVEKLGPSGHTRLGWSTQKGDVQAPVGFDTNSYAYRDLDGSKVHMAIRESYGNPYVEGDVIGFYINLPRGAEFAPKPPPLVSYRGRPYLSEMKEEPTPARIVPESEISFFRNGVFQGVAFKDINAGRYYPAASMYTLPNEPNCTVRFNFGPEFKFPPTDIGERPPPQPMSSAPFCGLDGGQEPVPVTWGTESHAVNVKQTTELQKLGEAG